MLVVVLLGCSLQVLDLSNTEATDDTLRAIGKGGLTSLHTLYLTRTAITDSASTAFHGVCTRLCLCWVVEEAEGKGGC